MTDTVNVPRDDDSRSFSDSLLPEAMIWAGIEVQEQVDRDNANYIAGETTDWDQGMIAVAIYRAMLAAAPKAEPVPFSVDDLAQEIRRVDGKHNLGAGALAEALMPYICQTHPEAPKAEPVSVWDERIDRFERAAFAKTDNLPRGKEAREAEIRRRDVEYLAARDTIRAQPEAPKVEQEPVGETYHARQIAEVMDEGDGFWRPCSGCQEGVDGYVSETDYPYNKTFRCQPGGGCSECGGLGVVWDDTDYEQMAREMIADEAHLDDPAPASDELLEALEKLTSSIKCVEINGPKDRSWGMGSNLPKHYDAAIALIATHKGPQS